MALALTVGGINVLDFLNVESVRLQDAEEAKGSTFNFELLEYDDPVPKPKEGEEVIFSDGSTREFAGVLTATNRLLGESNRLVRYQCEAMDYTYYFDRRFLNKLYASKRADLMAGDFLDDLKSAAATLDTHYNDFQSDKTQLSTSAPIVRAQRLERVLPSQAMEVLAESTGMRWRIDYNKRLILQPLGSVAAPLPSSSGDAILNIDENVDDYFDFEVDTNIKGIGTTSIAKGALIKSTEVMENTFIWTTGRDHSFNLSRRPFSELDIISVKADDVTLTQKLEDIEVAGDTPPNSGQCAIYVGPLKGGSIAYVRINPADIEDGQAVEVRYNYFISDDHESPSFENITEMANRTGGDGIHEFVYSRLNELAVPDLTSLDEVQEIVLSRKAKPVIRGKFSSFTKGWAAGQIFTLLWAKEGIEEQVYVVIVNKLIRSVAADPNTGVNLIESEITFSNIPRGVRL